MSYGTFKTLEEVGVKFDYKIFILFFFLTCNNNFHFNYKYYYLKAKGEKCNLLDNASVRSYLAADLFRRVCIDHTLSTDSKIKYEEAEQACKQSFFDTSVRASVGAKEKPLPSCY